MKNDVEQIIQKHLILQKDNEDHHSTLLIEIDNLKQDVKKRDELLEVLIHENFTIEICKSFCSLISKLGKGRQFGGE